MRNRFANELLDEHNKARAIYGNTPRLYLDEKLNYEAQSHANYLASAKIGLVHSKKPGLGENLFKSWNSTGRPPSPAKILNDFMKEVYFYRGGFSGKTGHFSQVVWKNSTALGVGIARSQNNEWFVVCNYYPAGNILGKFRENVLLA